MLKAVIVDDEQPAINMLKMLLKSAGVEVVGEYTKSSEVLKQIGRLQPDVVFLDIEMPGIKGIELAEHLLEQIVDTDVVFVTAFRNYAVEAFELNAVDYLLKPALQQNVDRAVARLLKQKSSRPDVKRMNTGIQISCFGKIEVRNSSGDSLVKWRTAKGEELFGYLLYHRGTIVPKGKIIDNLWPECEPEIADNNLHTTVYRLKKTLKESGLNIEIKFSGGGYIMELGRDIYCDADEFEAFIAKGEVLTKENITGFEKIAALFRGDYLEGKDYSWCMAERARLQRDFSYIVKQVVCYYIDSAEYKKAEQMLLKNIEYAPYDEEAYEILLRACFLQGDRVSVIKYYDHLEAILQKELGIEPRPSLKRLYENYLNQF